MARNVALDVSRPGKISRDLFYGLVVNLFHHEIYK